MVAYYVTAGDAIDALPIAGPTVQTVDLGCYDRLLARGDALSIRNERGSVIITTNLEFSRWGEFFPDAMLTAALVDRLTHHSYILNMYGESYRLKEKLRQSRCDISVVKEQKPDPLDQGGSVSKDHQADHIQ